MDNNPKIWIQGIGGGSARRWNYSIIPTTTSHCHELVGRWLWLWLWLWHWHWHWLWHWLCPYFIRNWDRSCMLLLHSKSHPSFLPRGSLRAASSLPVQQGTNPTRPWLVWGLGHMWMTNVVAKIFTIIQTPKLHIHHQFPFSWLYIHLSIFCERGIHRSIFAWCWYFPVLALALAPLFGPWRGRGGGARLQFNSIQFIN